MLPAPLPGRYLAVDPGARSGWAIVEAAQPFEAGAVTVLHSGECEAMSREPDDVCECARGLGCEAMVIELPGLGGRMTTPTMILGLGGSIGIWKRAWRLSRDRGRSVIVEVPAMTWRATIIGGGQRTTASWKADAAAHVRRTMNIEAGPEEADAICLGEHALCSLDLADAVGVRRLGKFGWAEPWGCWVEGRWRPT